VCERERKRDSTAKEMLRADGVLAVWSRISYVAISEEKQSR
jgi:hypothetical protein